MSGRTILNLESPKSQSIEAVKSFLLFVGRAVDPLPQVVDLAGGMRLTLSGKRDAYYVTSQKECSCPARTFHPGAPCKHMKAMQANASREASREQARAYQVAQRARRAKARASSLPPAEQGDSLMPRGGFKPVLAEDERAISSPSPMAEACPGR